MKITMSRRELLVGVGAAFIAAAVTTATGIGAYKVYKSRNRLPDRRVQLVDSDRWLLSDSDYETLAAADALVDNDAFVLYDEVDHPGGAFASQRVGSLGECIEACASDPRCRSFTYANSTHELPGKRQMCWLKEVGDLGGDNRVVGYVSGQRR